MAYQKPICDCGTYLHLWEESVCQLQTRITKNGKPSKKKIIILQDADTFKRSIGVCPACKKEYWLDKDNKGRLIKGEKFNC